MIPIGTWLQNRSQQERQQIRIGQLLMIFAIVLFALKPLLPATIAVYPETAILPMADWLNALFAWLQYETYLSTVSRWIAKQIQFLIDVFANILYGKSRWPRLDALPWTVVAATAAMLGLALGRGWGRLWLAVLAGGTFTWCAVFGQWKLTMETLSVLFVAVPIAVALGLVLGILSWRFKSVERFLAPMLNLAQSMPHYSYMIPVVIFVGVGAKAGAIVTIIFAMPPMVRLTALGLKRVPNEVIESGHMAGATEWQLLRKVRIPTARSDLLIGVNQVIMQSLAMVVLAALIGMPGLGGKLFSLLSSPKIGKTLEVGITVVLIAVVLDRLSRAWAVRPPVHWERGTPWYKRHRMALIWLATIGACFVVASFWDYAYKIGVRERISFSKPLTEYINVFRALTAEPAAAFRAFAVQYVLIPIREFFRYIPYPALVAFAAGVGWAIGGRKTAISSALFVLFLAVSGWYDRAMITAYYVFVSLILAMSIGFPIGIWAAGTELRTKIVLAAVDTGQTLPSFVYLVPAIMLFQVSDVAVLLAILIYALVPIIRYTIEGIRAVPATQLEAVDMAGASRWQKLKTVQLPLAFPTIMIGVNQCVLFSLFMVVIASYIGTIDLGQAMQKALSETDIGKGLVLGLCVAFMGLLIDGIITRWSADRKRKLGLE